MRGKKIIIGVMGPGKEAGESLIASAFELGKLIAENGWVVLSGGVNTGVMDAVSRGAKEKGGLTVGILPRIESEISEGIDIPIITDMGSARNNINVLSSSVVIACGINTGTASEIALALQDRAGKHVVLLDTSAECLSFFKSLQPERVHLVKNPNEAVLTIQKLLSV